MGKVSHLLKSFEIQIEQNAKMAIRVKKSSADMHIIHEEGCFSKKLAVPSHGTAFYLWGKAGGRANFIFFIWQKSHQCALLGPIR